MRNENADLGGSSRVAAHWQPILWTVLHHSTYKKPNNKNVNDWYVCSTGSDWPKKLRPYNSNNNCLKQVVKAIWQRLHQMTLQWSQGEVIWCICDRQTDTVDIGNKSTSHAFDTAWKSTDFPFLALFQPFNSCTLTRTLNLVLAVHSMDSNTGFFIRVLLHHICTHMQGGGVLWHAIKKSSGQWE